MIDFILMFLCALPIAAVGWFGGMVFMRNNYLRVIRWQGKLIARLQRNTVVREVKNGGWENE